MTIKPYKNFINNILATWAPAGNSIGALLVDETCVFDTNNSTVSDLPSGCIISQLNSNNSVHEILGATVTTIDNRKIFDLPDISFKVLDSGRNATAIILFWFNGTTRKLLCYIDTVANGTLPFETYPADSIVTWSNSASKVFSWELPVTTLTTLDIPEPALARGARYVYTDVVVPVSRPTDTTKSFERAMGGSNAIFKDINNMGKAHPITGDLTRVFDNEAIKKSIENILMTDPMEIPFSPKFGVGIQRYLFEINDPITANSIRDSIRRNLQEFEPRITVKTIDFVRDVDRYALGITIEYYINSLTGSQQFTLFIKRR